MGHAQQTRAMAEYGSLRPGDKERHDGHGGKPPTPQAPHLTCPHAHRLADVRGRRQNTQNGAQPIGAGSRAAGHLQPSRSSVSPDSFPTLCGWRRHDPGLSTRAACIFPPPFPRGQRSAGVDAPPMETSMLESASDDTCERSSRMDVLCETRLSSRFGGLVPAESRSAVSSVSSRSVRDTMVERGQASGAWGLHGAGTSSLGRRAYLSFSLPPKGAFCLVSHPQCTTSSSSSSRKC
jgi:hypothetical protein